MKVSVLLRTYNQASFIEEAVMSVLAQRAAFDYEVVIGDDASSDGTRGILESLTKAHPGRLRLLLRETNVGGPQNMIESYALCRGEYVAMLDGDDYWTSEEKLQRQASYLDAEPEVSICGHLWEAQSLCDGGPIEGVARADPRSHLGLDAVVRGYWLLHSTVMLRRSVLPAIPSWVAQVPMGDIMVQYLCTLAGKLTCLEDVMAVYRLHHGAMHSQLSQAQKWERHARTLEVLLQRVEPAYRRLLMRRMAGVYYALADAHENEGSLDKSHAALCRANELGSIDQRMRRQAKTWFPTPYRWLQGIKRRSLAR